MNKKLTIFLVTVVIVCFAGAAYYPIHYLMEKHSNEEEIEELRAIRRGYQKTDSPAQEGSAPESAGRSALSDNQAEEKAGMALPYSEKKKEVLDTDRILPQYREIYELNHDFIGWLTIPDTIIDYPVMQSEDNAYYLNHDFYKRSNANGELLLDNMCDAYTPSYNLIIAGHHMRSGAMFGKIIDYQEEEFWRGHKLVQFDTLMQEGTYVVTAAFYSADYAASEPGFRYYVVFEEEDGYEDWMRQVRENQLYDTGIDCRFGDEFLTLSTCAYQRENGRFVVIARKLRDEEDVQEFQE
ncbi:MAG: class B sortase [Lachnospiraceae bacterium]|nr:class B sortase [Lachnospiraceae bacterium]